MHPSLKIILVAILICCLPMPVLPARSEDRAPAPAAELSAPEKAVQYFYAAFQTGNPDLLSEVLIDGGSYAQFSPQYKIDTPNPVISGVEIVRKTAIKKWSGYGEPVDAGDVLVYVVTKKDSKRIARKPGVSMPDEKFSFLVRKINGQWKIVKVYAGWPPYPGQ